MNQIQDEKPPADAEQQPLVAANLKQPQEAELERKQQAQAAKQNGEREQAKRQYQEAAKIERDEAKQWKWRSNGRNQEEERIQDFQKRKKRTKATRRRTYI
jgi:hypothetical protein